MGIFSGSVWKLAQTSSILDQNIFNIVSGQRNTHPQILKRCNSGAQIFLCGYFFLLYPVIILHDVENERSFHCCCLFYHFNLCSFASTTLFNLEYHEQWMWARKCLFADVYEHKTIFGGNFERFYQGHSIIVQCVENIF